MAECWPYQAAEERSTWNNSFLGDDNGFRGLFRPSPGRIIKSNSAGNSPRTSMRRESVTGRGNRRGHSARSDAWDSSFYAVLLRAVPSEQRLRAISWHPSSVQSAYYQSQPITSWNDNISQPIVQHDLITPASYLTPRAPSPSQYPLAYGVYEESHPSTSAYQNLHMDVSNSNCVGVNEATMTSVTCPLQQGHPGVMLRTSFDPYNMSGLDDIYPSSMPPTASSTPDILPIQQFHDEPKTPPFVASETNPVNDELVGMGLYDEPETFPVWDHSLAGLSGTEGTDRHIISVHRSDGKGLKLEETFDPLAADDDDDEEGDGEAKEEDETVEQSPHQTDQGTAKTPNEKLQVAGNEPWLVTQNDVSIYQPGLANSSFFFDNEDDSELDISTSHQLLALPQNMSVSHCGFQYGWI